MPERPRRRGDDRHEAIPGSTDSAVFRRTSYFASPAGEYAPFDRYEAGEPAALTAEERLGLRVFRGKGLCTSCHFGPTLSDERFHNTGVAWNGRAFTDEGRAAVSKNARDRGAFKTPSLRDVARTAPYMHNGAFERLEDVVTFYSEGGRPNPSIDPDLLPLRLNPIERSALVAFLRSLTGVITEGGARKRGSGF